MRERTILIADRVVEYCLYGMILFIPISIAAIEILVSLAILAFIIKKILKPDFRFVKNLPHLFLLFFFVFSALSFLNSGPYIKESVRAIFSKWFEYIWIFLMAQDTLSSRKRLRNAVVILLVMGFVVGISALCQRFLGIEFLRQRVMINIGGAGVYAITGSFKHFNDFGAYLLCVLSLAIGLSLWPNLRKQNRLGLGSLGVLLGVCLLLTLSRGSWLGFTFALVSMLILSRKFKTLSAVLGIFLIVLLFLPLAKEKVMGSWDSGRFAMWDGTLAMIRENPFFGKGLNTFMNYYPYYAHGSGIQYAHNCYLQMWSEIGIFGMVSFVLFVGSILFRGIKAFRDSPLQGNSSGTSPFGDNPFLLLSLICAIFGFLIHSFFDTQLYSLQLSALFWVLLGMVAGFG